MKKHLFLLTAATLCCSSFAFAQMDVVKAAERAQKEKKSAAEVVQIITPAFSDPETAELAQTYYIPGKAYFAEVDKFIGLQAFGQLPENGDKTMADDLLGGYDMFMKVLPLDSVPDVKGKIKPKYSKDVINVIAGHSNDYLNAGSTYYNAQDFDNAYKAFGIYTTIYDDPRFAGKAAATADTIVGLIYFYQGTSAALGGNDDNAMKAYEKAKAKGYLKKELFDNAIGVAFKNKNNDQVLAWAKQANELYGADNANYIGNIIDVYLMDKQYDKANAAIDEAISINPANSQYYFIKGVIYNYQDDRADAIAMYKKALELNPENVQALTRLGISLCDEAYAVNDAAPTSLSTSESEAYFNEKVKPLFIEASGYLEKAWELDNDNMDALRYLDNIYYNLRDEAKQKEVQQRML